LKSNFTRYEKHPNWYGTMLMFQSVLWEIYILKINSPKKTLHHAYEFNNISFRKENKKPRNEQM